MAEAGPAVVVLGASVERPPPGIDSVLDVVELRYADDLASLRLALPGAQVMLMWRTTPGQLENAWDVASELRWIQTASAGVDSVLFPELIEADVVLTNARGVFDRSIAEWVIGAMLAFVTGLHRSIVDQQHRRWTHDRTTVPLAASHLVVVGPGPIGRGAGARALALGMKVTMVGRSSRLDETFGVIVERDRLLDVIGEADFVLDAVPLTEATKRMFDAAVFERMKPSARFLNVGRGATVDEDALVEAVRTGRIAGAALDVFATEPLPTDSPLWTVPTVIVSPHISGDVEGWEHAVIDLFAQNARRWVAGEPLVNLIDKRTGHG